MLWVLHMKQIYRPPGEPPPQEGLPDASGPSPSQKWAMQSAEDVTEDINNIIEEGETLKPLTCCGRLPCKGRTPACFACDLCMDCISGIGCSHPSSHHNPQSAMTLG